VQRRRGFARSNTAALGRGCQGQGVHHLRQGGIIVYFGGSESCKCASCLRAGADRCLGIGLHPSIEIDAPTLRSRAKSAVFRSSRRRRVGASVMGQFKFSTSKLGAATNPDAGVSRTLSACKSRNRPQGRHGHPGLLLPQPPDGDGRELRLCHASEPGPARAPDG